MTDPGGGGLMSKGGDPGRGRGGGHCVPTSLLVFFGIPLFVALISTAGSSLSGLIFDPCVDRRRLACHIPPPRHRASPHLVVVSTTYSLCHHGRDGVYHEHVATVPIAVRDRRGHRRHSPPPVAARRLSASFPQGYCNAAAAATAITPTAASAAGSCRLPGVYWPSRHPRCCLGRLH